MNLKSNCKYALACITSMGVRLTPENRQTVQDSTRFFMQASSAETNALNIASSLGMKTLAMTNFVRESPVAAFIRRQLRMRGIDFTGKEISQEGPWGYRHQFNIADSGEGLRLPRVWNDRAGEAGQLISASDFDFNKIFREDGVQILHLSGLIAAVSPSAADCCLQAAKAASEAGTLVSFDLNYRASLWEGRKEELLPVFTQLAALSDILEGTDEDYCFCLDLPEEHLHGSKPKPVKEGSEGDFERYRNLLDEVRYRFPKAKVLALPFRKIINAADHLVGDCLWAEGGWYTENYRRIPVTDCIGTGDAMTGGLLYAVLKDMPKEKWLPVAVSCGALACSSLTDYAVPADERQLEEIYNGGRDLDR
ncbi:MAG: sugar kinase [Eubacterium sp.]|nr:sugar kinase [Eubacterium sp.]